MNLINIYISLVKTSLYQTKQLTLKMIKTIPPVLGFAANTQHLKPGYLFFALKGEKQDGHSFLETAAKKGANIAVVNQNYQGPDFGLKLIRVENVLNTLQAWAKQTLKTKKLN